MPDGRHYVFLSRRSLWALPEERGFLDWSGSEPVQLTQPEPIRFDRPTPSRDGRQLFARGTQQRAELVRRDPESGRLAPFLSGISAIGVAFSRDGEWVAYVSYPGWVLWRSRVDGSERLQLTSRPMSAVVPRWSPDGSRIA